MNLSTIAIHYFTYYFPSFQQKYEKKFINHSRDSRADLRNRMINLARKYQQGGIFEFTRGSKNNLIRSTVPVCIPDCQSKAELEIFPLKTVP